MAGVCLGRLFCRVGCHVICCVIWFGRLVRVFINVASCLPGKGLRETSCDLVLLCRGMMAALVPVPFSLELLPRISSQGARGSAVRRHASKQGS